MQDVGDDPERRPVDGADVDRHLTGHPVGAGDPADDQLHERARVSAHLVDVDEVDTDTTAAERGHDGAQRPRGATATADHLAQVIGMDTHLEDTAAPQVAQLDLDLVRGVDDPANEVLERLLEHQLSVASSPAAASVAGAEGVDFSAAAASGAGASGASAAGASVASAAGASVASAAGASVASAAGASVASAAGSSVASAAGASGAAA